MTTMRRRKKWLLARQQESLRSKQNNWVGWKQFFIDRVRAAIKTAATFFKAVAGLIKGVNKMLDEARTDPVVNQHLKKHGINVKLIADKEKK